MLGKNKSKKLYKVGVYSTERKSVEVDGVGRPTGGGGGGG